MTRARKTVFTNGCFDIVHLGHLELLEFCCNQGKVIVGINSDDSVRRLKGPGRPIHSVEERIKMLESIKFVDEVHVFDEDTPYRLIKELRPDIIVKGGDYEINQVVGRDLAEVQIFKFKEGFSTTRIIDKLKSLTPPIIDKQIGILTSEIHQKGWGYEEWLVNNSEYCGKILYFNMNKKCSYHFHKLKTETFYVASGKVRIYFSSQDEISSANRVELVTGDIFHVPVGLRHQIEALEDSKVFEISTHHLESDSYRIIRGD